MAWRTPGSCTRHCSLERRGPPRPGLSVYLASTHAAHMWLDHVGAGDGLVLYQHFLLTGTIRYNGNQPSMYAQYRHSATEPPI